ncbi:MAG TPA: ATP-dependent Clp protease proteolytic subunit, partial [Spirochaetaceae bacterium]|nr:ATP-dependent Clp protease proteolytic subunit [Spirochaetaceae bacterium]
MNTFESNSRLEEEDEKKKKDSPMDKETLLKTRIITLFSEINKDSAQSVIQQLIMLDNDDCSKPIWIYVNSPGGEVDSGLAIYDMIRLVKSPVNMLGVGLIAS